MKQAPPTNNFYGHELYQIIARKTFPVLVQLSTDPTQPTITYGQLADKINIITDPYSALRMNEPLGSIWKTLFEHQQSSGIDIPYLTTIVVNATTGLPTYFRDSLKWSRKEILNAQKEVYEFQQWTDIMKQLLNK